MNAREMEERIAWYRKTYERKGQAPSNYHEELVVLKRQAQETIRGLEEKLAKALENKTHVDHWMVASAAAEAKADTMEKMVDILLDRIQSRF